MRSAAEIEKLVSDKIFSLTHKRITSPQEELVESGILTSITIAELTVELERALRVTIPFIEVNKENFRSAESIQKLLLKKV